MSTNDPPDRPRADPERERFAREFFPTDSMSADEYAARHAADMACFSCDEFTYEDATLDAWIQRLGAILRDPQLLDECRKRFLTRKERARMIARANEEF
jgi:hypothetical protein